MAYKTTLPWIANASAPGTPVGPGANFAKLIAKASWQKRKDPVVHPLLMAAAQVRAQDMADKDYFSHTSPTGVTPNEVLRATGYVLPSWYPEKGNQIESIAINMSEDEALNAWFKSESHRIHVVGETDFYRNQRAVGVGIAKRKKKPNIIQNYVYVFLSAPLGA